MPINPNNITTIQVVQLDTVPFTLDSVIPHQPANELKQGTVQSLVDLIATALDTGTGVGFLPISVTNGQQLPDLPETPSFFLCGAGTYLNVNGFPNIICTAELNAIMSLTDHWALAVEIPITAPVGIQSVTGSAVDNTDPQNPVIDANIPPLQTVVEQGNRYTGATGFFEIDVNGNLNISRTDEEFVISLNYIRGLEISTSDAYETGISAGAINFGTNLDGDGFTGFYRQKGFNNAYYSLGNRLSGYYDLATLDEVLKLDGSNANTDVNVGDYGLIGAYVKGQAIEINTSSDTKKAIIRATNVTSDTNFEMPSTGGTLALLSDIASASVSSVNTKTGAVVLNTDDISESGTPNNKWFTDVRARASVFIDTYFGSFIDTLTPKTTLANADIFSIADVTDSYKSKKITWSNFKSALASAFFLDATSSIQTQLDAKALKSDYMVLSSAYTLANSTSLQKMFNVGSGSNGAFNTTANKTYRFRIEFDITGLSTTSSSIGFGFLGTAVISSLNYKANAAKQGLNSNASPFLTSIQVATSSQITTATTTATAKGMITGIIRCTTAGTLIPAISTSIGVTTAQVEANSYFEITEIGSNTLTATSNIS